MHYQSVLVILTLVYASVAENFTFPANSVIDLSKAPYYLDTTGVKDASNGLQEALDDATRGFPESDDAGAAWLYYRKTLYLPNGTYRITKPVEMVSNLEDGRKTGCGFTLQGQSRNGVILKLADNSPAFSDATKPRPVFATANPSNDWVFTGFIINLFDFTVEVGKGNPGAAGIVFIVNNSGSMRDVTIRAVAGSGWAGIDMETVKIPGPGLVKNVLVDGFDWGLRIAGGNYGMTIEHLTLDNQRLGGIRNAGNMLHVRRLTTRNIGGPSVRNTHGDGMITLVESDLNGMAGSGSAIQNDGYLFAREINSSGYSSVLQDHSKTLNCRSINEYFYGTAHALFGTPGASLRLPVRETPALPDELVDTSRWVDVTNYDAKGPYYRPWQPGGTVLYTDNAPLIQKAIDWINSSANTTGKSVIYFPQGGYSLATGNVRVYGNVRRILFNNAYIKPRGIQSQKIPFLLIDKIDTTLFIEQLIVAPGGQKVCWIIENRSVQDLVMRNVHIGSGKAYINNGASGNLFLEDVCALSNHYYGGDVAGTAPQFEFGNQSVWARQLDTEMGGTKIHSSGGTLWALGIKTEDHGTVLHAINNAKVEILGGFILPSFSPTSNIALTAPLIHIQNSTVSCTFGEHQPPSYMTIKPYYQNLIVEEKGTLIDTLARGQTAKRNENRASVVPFFRNNGIDVPKQCNDVSTKTPNKAAVHPRNISIQNHHLRLYSDNDAAYTCSIFAPSGRLVARHTGNGSIFLDLNTLEISGLTVIRVEREGQILTARYLR